MEYSGYATDWDEVVFRGDPESREFIAFWLEGGRVVAGMNVNVRDVNDQVQELIRSCRRVDRARLADPEVPLAGLAGAEPKQPGEGTQAQPPQSLLAQGINSGRRFVGGRLTGGEETPVSDLTPRRGHVAER
jgi:3-phenylpropionate/trans-cinnamate dioxygenase ferredoxin reductase subunit